MGWSAEQGPAGHPIVPQGLHGEVWERLRRGEVSPARLGKVVVQKEDVGNTLPLVIVFFPPLWLSD
jgi:hypothetical protein